jgi:hypothetical protein
VFADVALGGDAGIGAQEMANAVEPTERVHGGIFGLLGPGTMKLVIQGLELLDKGDRVGLTWI